MDSQGWRCLYRILVQEARGLAPHQRRPKFTDLLIVGMFLWAVAHDRPMCWACRPCNYHGAFRPRKLPSASQFSRRLREERTEQLLGRVFERLAEPDRPTPVIYLDGKPLVVGACSKDPDAHAGRVYGGFARGYKLHAITTEDKRILCWAVAPLNVDERTMAATLLAKVQPQGLVLADGNYDSSKLYDQVAESGGYLLTPLPKNAGTGHHYQSPWRLAAIEAWQCGYARYVYADRIGIEQCLGNLTSYGGGLGPLPAWVRTLPRVHRWVGAKLILYHARLRVERVAA
jgi:hypothetical protein